MAFQNSPWSCYIHDTVDYDEFQAYNVLDTADTGLGYRLLKNDNITLIGRIGGGYSHYYGGPDNGRYFPEAVFGFNLEEQISKRQKLLATVEMTARDAHPVCPLPYPHPGLARDDSG